MSKAINLEAVARAAIPAFTQIDSVTGLPAAQKNTGGAAFVADQIAPSAYSSIHASSTTQVSELLATGVTRVALTNLDTTAANYLIFAFGTSQVNAESNVATGGEVIRANSEKILRVPSGALAIAWKSAAGTPACQITQGV